MKARYAVITRWHVSFFIDRRSALLFAKSFSGRLVALTCT